MQINDCRVSRHIEVVRQNIYNEIRKQRHVIMLMKEYILRKVATLKKKEREKQKRFVSDKL